MSVAASPVAPDRSPEQLLDQVGRRGKRWLWFGVAWLVVLIVVFALPSSEGRNIVRLVALVLGPVYLYLGVAWLRLVPNARTALAGGSMPARLETKVRYGYALRRYLNAQLWPSDDDGFQLARFSETLLRALPRYLDVKRAPAQVYGEPTEGAVVVVICDEGVVVGRIAKSNYGAITAQARAGSAD